MPRPLALTGITAHILTHYINEQNTEERRKKLEIYILRQVNTLDKGFKLSYACNCKVFHCCWQTIPNFNKMVSKKVLSNIHATLTYKQFTNMPIVLLGKSILSLSFSLSMYNF